MIIRQLIVPTLLALPTGSLSRNTSWLPHSYRRRWISTAGGNQTASVETRVKITRCCWEQHHSRWCVEGVCWFTVQDTSCIRLILAVRAAETPRKPAMLQCSVLSLWLVFFNSSKKVRMPSTQQSLCLTLTMPSCVARTLPVSSWANVSVCTTSSVKTEVQTTSSDSWSKKKKQNKMQSKEKTINYKVCMCYLTVK